MINTIFKPSVVFLAFSNDATAFLSALKTESDIIYDTLRQVEDNNGNIVVRREESAENKDIDRYLRIYKDRLAIFHYSGHAEGTILSFEDSDGNANGLANKLGIQRNLKLVFLNACSTKEQVELYIKAGVTAVIATSLPVVDEHAMQFSASFYKGLASELTIEEAYLSAIGSLKQRFSRYTDNQNSIVFYEEATEEPSTNTRAVGSTEEVINAPIEDVIEEVKNVQYITRKLVRRGAPPKPNLIPWRLYVNAKHKDTLQWKITEPPIREYLQQGSVAYFELLEESRFHYVDFDRKAYIKDTNGIPREVTLQDEIKKYWNSTTPNITLIGKAGTGKTTNMVILWQHLVSQSKGWDSPIPIYVSLTDYNRDENERNFIIYYISEYYLGKEKLTDAEFKQLRNIFAEPLSVTNDEGHPVNIPAFVLILDGLDEVLNDQDLMLNEINEFSRYAQGTQIILTNTHLVEKRWAEDFNIIELKSPKADLEGVDAAILNSSKFTNQNLSKLLENPMMRTAFLEGEKVMNKYTDDDNFNFKAPITTRGELLWNNSEVRLAQVYEKFVIGEDDPFMYYHFKFFTRHFMPYVAYLMHKSGQSKLNEDQLRVVIEEVIENIYQRHFLRTYKEYRRYFGYFDLHADNWVQEEERFEILMNTLTNRFDVFVREGDSFKFTHQLYLEFLAAVHIQNDITLSLKKGELPISLKERRFNSASNMYLILGELEGEQYNQTEEDFNFNEQQTLLEQTLERCRNIFDRRIIGHTVWNILNIWRALRGELSGLNLSGLNLRGFSLNGVKLQEQDHQNQQSSRFDNTLIDYDVFFSNSEKARVNTVRLSKYLTHDPKKYPGLANEQILLFASGSMDGTIKLWENQSRKCFDIFDDTQSPIRALDFSNNGRYVYGVSDDGMLRIWDINDRDLIFKIQAHDKPITSLALTASGDYLATASHDSTIKIWQQERYNHWSLLSTLEGHEAAVECLDFSPNEKLLASGSWDRKVRVWDWENGECLWSVEHHVSLVKDVKFSKDGNTLLSGSSDDTILEWQTSDGKVIQKYYEHRQGVNAVAYAANRELIASASNDKTIKLWKRDMGECILTLSGHEHYVTDITFSPNDQWLISGSADGTIKMWEVETGDCVHHFENFNGLHVQGVDLRLIHQDSQLTLENKNQLREFGAIFSAADESAWYDLSDRLCYLFEGVETASLKA